MRLSVYLSKKHNLSRRFVKNLIHEGRVRADGVVLKNDIEVNQDERRDYTLDMIVTELSYELGGYLLKKTDETVFLYKPPLMHTERLTPEDPLCLDDIVSGSFEGYSLTSRLDYGVSGVVPAVRNDIKVAFQQKKYLAWVKGEFDREGSSYWAVDADKRRKVRAYEDPSGGKVDFKVLKFADGVTLIEIKLEKAARHQVRAVCAAMGHPIMGDSLYADAREQGIILLHCAEVMINKESCESGHVDEFIKKGGGEPA